MAGIIPDNFSVDMGQQLMSNIVNLYAQKQQLDEKRKLEDERYKREQQMWNERQTSTEEREKRMAEYNLGLQTEAQTRSAINKLSIDTSANLYNGIQSMIQRAQTDEAYRQDLESKGMSIDKMREITIEKLIRNGIESFEIGKNVLQENLIRVQEEKGLEEFKKQRSEIQSELDVMKFINATPKEQTKMIQEANKNIQTKSSELFNKIYGQTQKTQISTIQPTSELDKLELELSDKREKLNMLLQSKNQTPQIKEAIKNQRTEIERLNGLITSTKLSRETERLKPDKTQSSGTKAGKESIDYQNQYNSLNKSLQEAKSKGNDSLIKSIENKIVNVKADAAKKGITIKENQTNISTQIKSNPIIQNAVNAIYSEQKKGFNFNADIIKKSLQTIESNYNPESASSIENFILKNKSRFEEALNLWGDARKSDAITRLLREFEEKNKQSQQPPQNKGMQKSNTDPLGLFK